jgi:hypothetical protein
MILRMAVILTYFEQQNQFCVFAVSKSLLFLAGRSFYNPYQFEQMKLLYVNKLQGKTRVIVCKAALTLVTSYQPARQAFIAQESFLTYGNLFIGATLAIISAKRQQ